MASAGSFGVGVNLVTVFLAGIGGRIACWTTAFFGVFVGVFGAGLSFFFTAGDT